ncbi:pyridoxamine 5'-phosphate oxidase family protein [Sphingomonas sp. GCM10030256]|uniref:pyridoxamine 5'-phosphate oxidase family protein n=1 Tax=Sphingomonas sp. GCM10030256 TaxID=3273427 RepID=UPI00361A42B8
MEAKAVKILDQHGIMAIATLRPDGWPQNTYVAYANDGTLIYFLVSRSSQKFANIRADQRVAIAIGSDEGDLRQHQGLTLAAIASEVTDLHQRERALELMLRRHPAHARFGVPDFAMAAMMRAQPSVISILDYTQGFGHVDEITLGASDVPDMSPARTDNWGWKPAPSEPDSSFLA